MNKYPLSIAVFNSSKSNIGELSMFVSAFNKQSHQFEPHKIYIIETLKSPIKLAVTQSVKSNKN